MHCQLYLISSFMWIDVDDPLCYYMYHKVHSRNTVYILCVRSYMFYTHIQPVVVCVYTVYTLCKYKVSYCASTQCLLLLLCWHVTYFLCSSLSLTVHGVAAAQPAPVHLWLRLRGPSVSRHHAQRGSTHHADHQIHRILQEHLHPPREQRFCYCGLLWRWTGACVHVVKLQFISLDRIFIFTSVFYF